jgi:phenylpropionate dioxygenase-like ring-hydroxylating dioxygenase large terminal subunit
VTSFVGAPALRRHFFAVARSADVAPGPVGVTLLGTTVVLFRDRGGTVGALPDRCPHREMPLSKGFVGVFGELVCGYHGWAYACDGVCTRIPSSHATATPAQARLRPYQVRERYGLVWVALDPDPVAEPPVVAQDADPSFRRIVAPTEAWACAATRMVDNFCDIAHFPFVHTGTFGSGSPEEVPGFTIEALDGDFRGYRYTVDVANPREARTASGQDTDTVRRHMTTGFALPTAVRSTIRYEPDADGHVLEHVLLLCSTPVYDERSLFTFVVWRNDGSTAPDDEVIAFDRAIGAEDKAALEQVPGTLALDANALVSVQADRCSVAWRRAFATLVAGTADAPVA